MHLFCLFKFNNFMIFFSTIGQFCNLNKKYHLMVNQLANGLQPTRNLKTKYITNSKPIKTTSNQLSSGVINVWNFLVKSSFACSSYEQRQRFWHLHRNIDNNDDNDVILNNANESEEEDIVPEEVAPNITTPTSSTAWITCMIIMPGEGVRQYIVLPCWHAWVYETCVVNVNTLGISLKKF